MAAGARSDLDARGGGALDGSSDVRKAAVVREHISGVGRRQGRDQAETRRGQAGSSKRIKHQWRSGGGPGPIAMMRLLTFEKFQVSQEYSRPTRAEPNGT